MFVGLKSLGEIHAGSTPAVRTSRKPKRNGRPRWRTRAAECGTSIEGAFET